MLLTEILLHNDIRITIPGEAQKERLKIVPVHKALRIAQNKTSKTISKKQKKHA